MDEKKQKVSLPINFQVVDMKQFSQYLEALSEDMTGVIKKLEAQMAKSKEAEMKMAQDLNAKIDELIKALKGN